MAMQTVVLGPPPAELKALIARRRALGIDGFDEVWEGAYHVAPMANMAHGLVGTALMVFLASYAKSAGLRGSTAFNLGVPENFRVPDGAYHRGSPKGSWIPTAAIVVEVVSPHDETYLKFGFYAAHEVDELIVADPCNRTVTLWRRSSGDSYEQFPVSKLLGIGATEIIAGIDWPDVEA